MGWRVIGASKSYVDVDGTRHGMLVVPAHDPSAPVVMVAHGGPGSPLTPLLHANRFDVRDVATVVVWDQRGAGMSAHGVDPSTLTLDRVVSDTVGFARHVFGSVPGAAGSGLFLLGHSWGSFVGAVAVRRAPRLFSGFVGVGQVNSMTDADAARLTFFRQQAVARGDSGLVDTLDALVGRDLGSHRPWAAIQEREQLRTGTGMLRRGYRRGQVVRDILRCSPYSLWERAAVMPGMFRSYVLLREIYTTPLLDLVPSLDVPVHVFAGTHDQVTPATDARTFFEGVDAPDKSWTEFPDSAHSPFIDEPDRFREALRAVVA